MGNTKITVVVPVYNEGKNISQFLEGLEKELASVELELIVLFVNDGSEDNTQQLIIELSKSRRNVFFVQLSRNFGKEAAITAGLDCIATGPVVLMDGDGQHPAGLIWQFVESYKSGYEVIYGVRQNRRLDQGWFRRLSSIVFFKLVNLGTARKIDDGAGDFRLIGPRALEALKQYRERSRFMKGLYQELGFNCLAIPYEPSRRLTFEDRSRWTNLTLLRLAIDGLTSFSVAPVRAVGVIGGLVTLLALLLAIYEIINTIVFRVATPGYTTVLLSILFLGGFQLTALGIVGEYIAKIYMETKARPIYNISSSYLPDDIGGN
jgi:glycosyltransferase involved in cell wall biosynthesis